MNKIILKYPVAIVYENVLLLPCDYKIISVAYVHDSICIYVLVPANFEQLDKVEVNIDVRGTGRIFDDTNWFYIGTVIEPNPLVSSKILPAPHGGSPYVWHIFHNLNP